MTDLAVVEHIIAEVAAAEIMPRFRKLQADDVVMKGKDDPVTVADQAAEKALTLRLKQLMPGSVVIGEEGFAEDSNILSHFTGEPDVWIIDPIDGTRNFISGKPEFAVMVALVRRQQTVAAWIYDPHSGDCLRGEQGSGVWLRGEKVTLASHDRQIAQTGIMGSRLRKSLSHPQFAVFMEQSPVWSVGSAAAFCYGRLFTGNPPFAASKAERASYLLFRYTKPWDHIPGLFLHSEAGGHAADFTGQPYNAHKDMNGLLVAPDLDRWQACYDRLKPAIEHIIFE